MRVRVDSRSREGNDSGIGFSPDVFEPGAHDQLPVLYDEIKEAVRQCPR